MKIVYTRHALGKFTHPSIIKLGITKRQVEQAVEKPDDTWIDEDEAIELLIKKIDENHNLRVVYRKEDDIIIIITFHPAKKGRYEKIQS